MLRKKVTLLSTASAAVMAASLLTGSAHAGIIDLTFDGISPTYPFSSGSIQILNYYDGGMASNGQTGPSDGITFTNNALVICLNSTTSSCSNTSKGGLGDPNSRTGALFWLSGPQTFMDVPGGFTTGFSFNYADPNTGGASVSVYSGLDGTGTLLGTLNLALTPSDCPGYGAAYCPFQPIGVTFLGTAESVSFAGTANFVVYDDITLGSSNPGPGATPLPATLSLFAGGLGVLGMVARRRKKQQQAVA